MANAASALAAPASLELNDLTPTIGTEVHGIDLRQVPDAAMIDWLGQLLVARKVLFFRDQPITVAQHVAFGRCFGKLEVHPFTDNRGDLPEVVQLNNDRDNPPYINVWHSDVTWREEPSLGSILRARELPASGGDTLFADMEAAYQALDEATREQLAGRYAIHDNEAFLQGMQRRGASEQEIEAKRAEFPPQRHPIVRTHPVSGRQSLYVNRAFTRSIEGMEPSASTALLEQLYRQATVPEVQCRFRWQPDSLAFWDNRAVQHYAVADYWPQVRRMERVTIIGDRPR